MENLLLLMIALLVMLIETSLGMEILGIRSSSVYQGKGPELAIDGNPITCSQTGIEFSPWFKITLNGSRPISKIRVAGRQLRDFDITLGKSTSELGLGSYIEDAVFCESYNRNRTAPFDNAIKTTEQSCSIEEQGGAYTVVKLEVIKSQLTSSFEVCEIELF